MRPGATLRQRLFFAVDAADFLLLAVGEQVVMNGQPNFGDDLQLRQTHEHVEGIRDPPVRRILQRHDAEIGMAAVDLFKNRGDAADLDEFNRSAEAFDGGQVAEAILRPQIGDLQHLLQGPRAAHDLAEDGPDRAGIQRPLVGLKDILENFFLSGRRKDLAAVVVLDLADLRRHRGALVDKFQDLKIQFIDLNPKVAEWSGRPVRCSSRASAFGFARHGVFTWGSLRVFLVI
jgi:hypothetical protein